MGIAKIVIQIVDRLLDFIDRRLSRRDRRRITELEDDVAYQKEKQRQQEKANVAARIRGAAERERGGRK